MFCFVFLRFELKYPGDYNLVCDEDTEQFFSLWSPVVSTPQIWPFKDHIKEQLNVAVSFLFLIFAVLCWFLL